MEDVANVESHVISSPLTTLLTEPVSNGKTGEQQTPARHFQL